MAEDPALDPEHDLLDFPQDEGRRRSNIRLWTFLSLMRVLAGRRGHSSVRWFGGGFTYYVEVRREEGPPFPEVDEDPSALGGEIALPRITEALD